MAPRLPFARLDILQRETASRAVEARVEDRAGLAS